MASKRRPKWRIIWLPVNIYIYIYIYTIIIYTMITYFGPKLRPFRVNPLDHGTWLFEDPSSPREAPVKPPPGTASPRRGPTWPRNFNTLAFCNQKKVWCETWHMEQSSLDVSNKLCMFRFGCLETTQKCLQSQLVFLSFSKKIFSSKSDQKFKHLICHNQQQIFHETLCVHQSSLNVSNSFSIS